MPSGEPDDIMPRTLAGYLGGRGASSGLASSAAGTDDAAAERRVGGGPQARLDTAARRPVGAAVTPDCDIVRYQDLRD